MIFLGTLFPEEKEQEMIERSKAGVSNAANSFQWNMIRGIQENTDEPLIVIHVLPIGTWPRNYRKFYLRDQTWQYSGVLCHEVGGPNIPVIKQLVRTIKIHKLINAYSEEKEIIAFTAYLPFLRACCGLGNDRKVTAVITDIPEYYDMHQVSMWRKTARKLHNKLVYRYMAHVDRFVLLTEQMKEPLHVGDRPYIVMEGICDVQVPATSKENNTTFSLLYTGRLNKRYGLEALMDAVEKIDDPNLELWFCGSGEMEAEIQARSRKDARIKYFGFLPHEKIRMLQQSASVLVNPRTNKGAYTQYSFPSKTMEYMAAGKPVMMYRLDGIPAEYDPYLFYIPEETVDSICQTILRLRALTPEDRLQAGEQARAFVINQKNKTVQMRRVLNFLLRSR